MDGPLVHTDSDPHAAAAGPRHGALRRVCPFLTARLLVAAIGLITVYTGQVNRRGASALTRRVVGAIDEPVRLEVDAELAPSAAGARLLAVGAATRGIAGRLPAARALGPQMRGMMDARSEFASLFVGDGEGDRLMVRRDGAALWAKSIRPGDGADLEILEIGRFFGSAADRRGRARDHRHTRTRPGGVPPGSAPADFVAVPAVAERDDAILREVFQRVRIDRAERGVVAIDDVRPS
ncbi:MAG: hypothetical protein ACLFTG_02390 [Alphaproteobacteria bacterium]